MDTLYGNRQQLMSVAQAAQEPLMEASAIFPFDLFPDTIVVDRTKVTIHKRIFFGQAETTSVQLDDILNVELSSGPFLASLRIFTRMANMHMEPLVIEYLSRKSAIDIQSLIEGYIIAINKKIDCNTIPKKELVKQLVQLGHEAAPKKA
jgi:hypothetical protein